MTVPKHISDSARETWSKATNASDLLDTSIGFAALAMLVIFYAFYAVIGAVGAAMTIAVCLFAFIFCLCIAVICLVLSPLQMLYRCFR